MSNFNPKSFLKDLKVPERDADWEHFGYKIWFKEEIVLRQMSDLRWDHPYKLGICPLTKHLMYFDGYHSVGWDIIVDDSLNTLYKKWLEDFIVDNEV